MRVLIIGIFLAVTVFGFFLKYLTYTRMGAAVPDNVKDVFDDEAYRKNQAYGRARLGFSIVDGLIGMVFMLVILLFNVHAGLYDWIGGFTGNVYLMGLFMLGVPVLVGGIIDELVGIYSVFVIEERFGFNKMTAGTYVMEFIKNLLIAVVFMGGLLVLFLFLHGLIGNWVFPAFFFVLLAFRLFIMFISPFMIRIFYKLSPLEEGSLKERIQAMAEETGFKLKGIYKVDASKKSTKINAFASGFGKTKTIGLFDTMLEKMSEDEILSILAHEIGHAKERHIVKTTPLSLLTFGIMLAAAYFIVTMPEVSQAFGFADTNIIFGIYIVSIMLSPLMLVLQIPSNAISRKHEYEADTYSKRYLGAEVAVSALKTGSRENLANLTPHPFVVMMEYGHPPLSERIGALEK